MFGFGSNRAPARLQPLGSLESQVMEIVWERGESSVREVAANLARPLAYTTVMTTLDRLFKKGLLLRRKCERAFFYAPRLSREAWRQARANELMTVFLAGPEASRELLVSSFLDAAGPQDERLLEALEKKIRRKRQELKKRGQP